MWIACSYRKPEGALPFKIFCCSSFTSFVFIYIRDMHFVVIGGGVAGVACLEEILRVRPSAEVTLISASRSVKAVANYLKISDVLESFDLNELPLEELAASRQNIHAILGIAIAVDAKAQSVQLQDGRTIPFDRLCICAGAEPNLVVNHPLVVGVRDMQSVEDLAARLSQARRVVVLGNGGIALGLVHEIRGCDVVWAVRDHYIGSTFFDASASAFFLEQHAARIVPVEPPMVPPSVAPDVISIKSAGRNDRKPLSDAAPVRSRFYEEGCCGACSTGGGAMDGYVDGGAGGGDGSFNYHDDRPSAQALAAARAGMDDDNDDDADISIIPIYAPLPQRERKRGRKREVAPVKPVAQAPLEPESGASDGSASAAMQTTVYGGSLGPGWVAALRQTIGSQPAAGDAAFGPSAPTTNRVHLETRVQLSALRGSGPTGATGLLTDGRWHSVSELGAPASARHLGSSHHDQSVDGPDSDAPRCDPSSCPSPCPFPLHVRLSNGRVYGCDFLVSATGVVPVGAPRPPPAVRSAPAGTAAMSGSGMDVDEPAPAAQDGAMRLLPEGSFARNPADGGLVVNNHMQTSASKHVFAAGDAASVSWPGEIIRRTPEGSLPLSDPDTRVPLWFQMRLWNQARQQGAFAARAMTGTLDPLEEEDGGLAFELFAHATKFLGHRVTLLGLYNGQGLGGAYEAAVRGQVVVSQHGLESAPGTTTTATAGGGGSLGAKTTISATAPSAAVSTVPASQSSSASKPVAAAVHSEAPGPSAVQVQLRVTPGVEYAKLVLLHGRLVGALLVGETGLEETCENLILNRIRVMGSTAGGDGDPGGARASGVPQVLDLLHPDVDIEDYFD